MPPEGTISDENVGADLWPGSSDPGIPRNGIIRYQVPRDRGMRDARG